MSIRSFVSSTARRICGILVGLVLAPAAVGQTTITAPYNPDSDADSVIAILDLMSVLSIYGDAFEPAPIMIDGITLQEYLTVLEQGAGCVVGCQDEAACNYDSTATVGIACTCDFISCGCAPVTFDGHTYNVVEIGSQCWFAENLRTTVYADGTTIPSNLSNLEWSSTTSGAQAVSGEGTSNEMERLEKYGRLYNWYAVDDSSGLCPSGWHVPTDGEWMQLEFEIGMATNEVNELGWRGTDEGKKLMMSPQDSSSWDGYDMDDPLNSGFSGLPGGWRKNSGSYSGIGFSACWWSSSRDQTSNAWGRVVGQEREDILRWEENRRYGYSIRCLKDYEGQGCTDTEALNYDHSAGVDDGSCIYSDTSCDPVTFDGYTYEVVKIVGQCWFAENLRSEHYANGDLIAANLASWDWEATTSGAQAVLGEGNSSCYGSNCNDLANLDNYGRLYNWYAVEDSRALCPIGWHVPTDYDWSVLTNNLGFVSAAPSAMKSSPNDEPAWNGLNTSGFSALGAGRRSWNGSFSAGGSSGYWWSISPRTATSAWARVLSSSGWLDLRESAEMSYGHSVRCLKTNGPIFGCTEPDYLEFTPIATENDGSCETPIVEGCMNSDFLEFSETANMDDGSCLTLIIEGCTDSDYLEFDSTANVDDGSCFIPAVFGCMDAAAGNYKPQANIDDGSCVFYYNPDCSSVLFDGYTYEVVEIGDQCWFAENLRTAHYTNGDSIPGNYGEYPSWFYVNEGAQAIVPNTNCLVDCSEETYLETHGRLYNAFAVEDARGICPSGWKVPSDEEWMQLEMNLGMTVEDANNQNGRGTDQGKQLKASPQHSPGWDGYDSDHQLNTGFSALPSGIYWFGNDQVTENNGWANFWTSSSGGSTYSWFRGLYTGHDIISRSVHQKREGLSVRCILEGQEVYGCTDPTSCNYEASATIDDGSCLLNSLIWSLTTDYFPVETSWQITDSNGFVVAGDGPYFSELTTTVDTLCVAGGCYTLTVFDFAADGLTGFIGANYVLTDINGNVLAEMIEGGDFGSSAIHEFCLPLPEVTGCTDVEATNYDSSANVDDGSCTYGPPDCEPVTFDGYTYEVVLIDSQCWFAENLRATKYADGTTIPSNLSDSLWSSTTTGATAVYGEGSSDCNGYCDEGANLDAYGRLYNWYAVNDERGLCPSGWHVPTDDEYTGLTDFFGGTSLAGDAMKSSVADIPSWNGTNISGFSALPGGFRDGDDGSFKNQESSALWWSASLYFSEVDAWRIAISTTSNSVFRNAYGGLRQGFSVRCLRDDLIVGCTDSNYLEYDPLANTDDGTCATLVILGCTDSEATNYNPIANTDDGYCYYTASTCLPVNFDGHSYEVVEIGSQCWFAENLRTTVYANGDPIPGDLSNSEWGSTTSGAQTIYLNNATYLETYGRLYNWYAVDDNRGLCPIGWHVPTDYNEWRTLIDYFGGSELAGTALKSSPADNPSWDGTNISGFSALPSGQRNAAGFYDLGTSGRFWTASMGGTPSYSWAWGFDSDESVADNWYLLQDQGVAVRCLRDE